MQPIYIGHVQKYGSFFFFFQKYGSIKPGPTLLPLAADTLGALFCFVLHIPGHFWC